MSSNRISDRTNDRTTEWNKPGPGAWSFDGAHNVGPVTPIVQSVYPDAMADGFRSFTERYGLPLSHIEVAYVNGYAYGSVRIAGIHPSDLPPPPGALLRVLSRIHPEMRRRNRQALVALDQRVWRDDLQQWFEELRPARLAAVRSLQAVEPTELDDAALAEHVEACIEGLAAGLREHFSLVGAAGLPVGLYVLRETERGRSVDQAMTDLTGAAASSTAATLAPLAAVAGALADAGVSPTTLDEVRGASPAARDALDAYLGDYGQRVIGAFDVTGRRLVELPDLVLRSVIAAAGRSLPGAGVATGGTTPHESDPVLSDALLAVSSRDDHAGISCMWPLGLTRRALLAAGERLSASGRARAAQHVFEATRPEVLALLRDGSTTPSPASLAERAADRERRAELDPPVELGVVHPPPDPAVFPAGLRRTAGAMAAFLGALETAPDQPAGDAPTAPDAAGRDDGPGRVGSGVGVGSVAYRGRAVVAVDPEDAATRVRPGDVLITATTTPAFNCVLPVVGALVTEHGGPMSHAGIAAREFGIPAVLGVAGARSRITDGDPVDVDPVAGTVRLAPAHVAFGPGVDSPQATPEQVGGKAAGLIAMSAMGLPVPPGVVLPVALHPAGAAAPGGAATAGGPAAGTRVDAAVRAAVAELEAMSGRRLGDPAAPLLVSVRSGAAVSMPGMMDTVLNVGMTTEVAAALAREHGDPGFAFDTHRRFLVGFATVVGGLSESAVASASERANTPAALVRALADLGVVVPDEPIDQVLASVAGVHRSWGGERARTFREREGIDDDLGTAVTIQSMVFGNLGADSGTGVVFSRDPSTGAPGLVGDLLVAAQGEDVVAGTHATRPISEMAERWPTVHAELLDAVERLERHHADMVDVEFTVERGRLFLLQCRKGRRSRAAALRLAVDMANDPDVALDRAGAVARCRDLLDASPDESSTDERGTTTVEHDVIVSGLAASPGRGTGALVVSVDDALRRADAGEAIVLVRPETSPADVAAMSVARGIVTSTGGLVSHAAVVARSWDLPAVVGAAELRIDDDGVQVGARRIAVGEIVTVDGHAGVLLAGEHTDISAPPPELDTLRRWAAELDNGAVDNAAGDAVTSVDLVDEVDDLDVLRLVVLRHRTDTDAVVAVTGASAAAVRVAVDRLHAAGSIARTDGWIVATDVGCSLVDDAVSAVVERHGPAFAELLDRFQTPDGALKALVTDWQLHGVDSVPDPGAGLRVDVHELIVPVLGEASVLEPRLDRYRARLEHAVVAVESGDHRYLAHPSVDSYHGVWFELHEELIALAGTDRSSEAVAGRA